MKNINIILFNFFLILLPAVSWSISETELNALKDEKTHFIAAACQDNSFLRGCFHLSETDCTIEVKKSYEGCWKFIEKRVNLAALTITEWQSKIDGCTLRDVGLQSKFQAEVSPACALPKKEIL